MTPLQPVPPELADPSEVDPALAALAARLAAQFQQAASPAPQARAGLRGSRTLLSALSAAAGVVAVVYLATPAGGVTPPEVAQYAILALGTMPAALAARSGAQALRPPAPTYPQSYPQPQSWPPVAP